MPSPNVLLITTDQHNAEILGCAGNPTIQTPNLDRLAARGVLCRNAFTPHPVCTPARTTILTGQDSRRHGVPYNLNLRADIPAPAHHTGLRADATAFPNVLRQHGYHTSLFGKLHTKQAGDRNFGLQTTRLAEGKCHFVGHGAPPDDYRRFLSDHGYAAADWQLWRHPDYQRDGFMTSLIPDEHYIDTWTADEALTHLAEVEGPFCCWVSFSTPHNSWDPPAPYDQLYRPDAVRFPSRRVGELEEKHPNWVDQLARTVPPGPYTSCDPDLPGGLQNAYHRRTDDQTRALLAAYYGQIAHLDGQVGRLLDYLDETGQTDNTLVVFTADHGDQLGNNWAFYKYGVSYDSLARVPMLVSWPGRLPQDEVCEALCSLADLAPTFLDAAGVTPVDPFDGSSLLPLLEHRADSWREALLLAPDSRTPCVVTERWRYLRWHDGFEELYDRHADPHDLHNLAGPQTAAVLRELILLGETL